MKDELVSVPRWWGVCRGATECALEYAQELEAFWPTYRAVPGNPISVWRQMATETEAARLMVYNAARLCDADQDFLTEAAMAKYQSSVVAERVSSQAVEIYGGYGYSQDYPVEKY